MGYHKTYAVYTGIANIKSDSGSIVGQEKENTGLAGSMLNCAKPNK